MVAGVCGGIYGFFGLREACVSMQGACPCVEGWSLPLEGPGTSGTPERGLGCPFPTGLPKVPSQ